MGLVKIQSLDVSYISSALPSVGFASESLESCFTFNTPPPHALSTPGPGNPTTGRPTTGACAINLPTKGPVILVWDRLCNNKKHMVSKQPITQSSPPAKFTHLDINIPTPRILDKNIHIRRRQPQPRISLHNRPIHIGTNPPTGINLQPNRNITNPSPISRLGPRSNPRREIFQVEVQVSRVIVVVPVRGLSDPEEHGVGGGTAGTRV